MILFGDDPCGQARSVLVLVLTLKLVLKCWRKSVLRPHRTNTQRSFDWLASIQSRFAHTRLQVRQLARSEANLLQARQGAGRIASQAEAPD